MRGFIMGLLDIVGLVRAIRTGISRADRASALVLWVLTGLGTLVSGAFSWVCDWLPTWRFATGEAPNDGLYTIDTIAQEAIRSADGIARTLDGLGSMTLASAIGGLIAVGVTLTPTIIQFMTPLVLHPAVRLFSDMSIGFDFITDFPTAWAQAGAWVGTAGGLMFLVRLAAAIVLVFIYSVGLQTLFVLFAAAFVMSTIVIIRGGMSAGAHRTIAEY